MAIEAITQVNEDSPNPVRVYGYTLRDISIKAALVTPDDDNGIETLFSLRPAALGKPDAQDTVSGRWFDFNISSYSSEDGYWKDHMTGTVGINMSVKGEAPSIPILSKANIFAVGQAPATPPHMQVITSGKSWNQRFRSVGFDYGATFQDMDMVRSDGKAYAATSKTVIKQECGITPGESRYVLHPGTVDSCLQLIIVSIYSGKLNDMTCGAVPIQVDEVSIWIPTKKQVIDSRATAFAWTNQRGNRSFVSNTQLVSDDGELLMNISDIRCVAYEAAVPEKFQSNITSQPYMKMDWKVDVDYLVSPREIDVFNRPTVSHFIQLVAHKNAAVRILDVDGKSAAQVLSACKSIDYTIATLAKENITRVQEDIDEFEALKYLELDLFKKLENDNSLENSFDLIMLSEVSEHAGENCFITNRFIDIRRKR